MTQLPLFDPTSDAPEWRSDPLTGRWVIVARDRASRPRAFVVEPRDVAADVRCPFCAGNEAETPSEVLTIPETLPGSPAWDVRVVPNKYPALRVPDSGDHAAQLAAVNGHGQVWPGTGIHELVIESPAHTISTSELTPQQLALVLEIYARRLKTHAASGLSYAQVFKNVGRAAGASLAHSHSQILGLTRIPPGVAHELDLAAAYAALHGECGYCQWARHEAQNGERRVAENEHFVAFCPYVSRFPFETWILPRSHAGRYEQTPQSHFSALADLLSQTVIRLEKALGFPAYNYLIHTAPFDTRDAVHYHWHMELFPRLTVLAGFEFGTGSYINPVSPEQAARLLRSAEAATSPE